MNTIDIDGCQMKRDNGFVRLQFALDFFIRRGALSLNIQVSHMQRSLMIFSCIGSLHMDILRLRDGICWPIFLGYGM